ncbi:MAG: GerMN domain-containing protein [Thermodesulfobacteriota bacterium]
MPPKKKRKLKKRKKGSRLPSPLPLSVVIATLVTFAAGALFMIYFGDRLFSPTAPNSTPDSTPKKTVATAKTEKTEKTGEKPAVKKPASRTIKLFFGDYEGKELIAEKSGIRKGTVEAELKRAVEALLKGPVSGRDGIIETIPEGVKLLSLKVRKRTAVVDLSREIIDNHFGGSSAELQTVYSLVNTLTLNFPSIDTVRIMIEGKSEPTIAGHIIISNPLKPNRKLIKG